MSAPRPPRDGTVAVLGLGAMGSRIAGRLHSSGHQTVLWNRTPDVARRLAGKGGMAAASPAQACARAHTVIVTVSDPSALAAVTQGPDGIASAAHPGTLVIVMSTVGPAAAAELADALPAEADVLDAPFLGSVAEAERGTLQIFVSGTDAAARRAEPLLRSLGTPHYVGGLGTGSAAKLVANFALLGVLAVLGEAVALAGQLNLPRDKTFDILALTPLAEQAGRRRPAMESGQFPARFRLALARKDADLMLAAAGMPGDAMLPVLHSVRSWLLAAESEGRGDDDYTAMLDAIVSAQGALRAD